jgi:hypothetical protein
MRQRRIGENKNKREMVAVRSARKLIPSNPPASATLRTAWVMQNVNANDDENRVGRK